MTAADAPTIAVVVMAYRNEATVLAAVGSLVAQDPPATELVVVTSGGDRTAELVRSSCPEVRVIESTTRLLPGGARNAGVHATTSDVVAFLAADCRAEPGWIDGRLRAHAREEVAVASAIAVPSGAVAFASYLVKFVHRLPTRGRVRLHWPDGGAHGASFPRPVLERIGGFDETILAGEDSKAMADAYAAGVPITYDPGVCTVHDEPSSLAAVLRDHYRRGFAHPRLDGPIGVVAASRLWAYLVRGMLGGAWRWGRPLRRRVLVSSPFLALAVAAQVLGRFRGIRA